MGSFQVFASFQLIYSTFRAMTRQKVVPLDHFLTTFWPKCPLNQLKIGKVLKLAPQNLVPEGSNGVIWGQKGSFWAF